MFSRCCRRFGAMMLFGLLVLGTNAQAQSRALPPVAGRWDLVVHAPEGDYPSWLEVKPSGYSTLVGYFVGRFGSVRPISKVEFQEGKVRFALPPQWEVSRNGRDIEFEGVLSGDKIIGTTTGDRGEALRWTGVRAPLLKRSAPPKWGKPIVLFNGKDLQGWKGRDPHRPHGWEAKNGVLVNARPGVDIMTTRQFTDFRLSLEFRYPKGSNSGIYLRGRYEAQIEDNFGQEAEEHGIGGIYGFLKPRINAAKPAGAWQTYEVTLVGRYVTVRLNGETVIERQEIPGITGGAIDSAEGLPGPLLLQGDHGKIEYRNIVLTPAN